MSRHKEVEPNNPAFPNGWFPLVESDDVPAGQVVSVVALGQKWCVYRGETGRAYVLDAYCPHLGADLSAGGHVVGDCVECPFHGWRFDGSDNGRCTLIPYAEKPPEAARASKRDSCEKNGFIFVWYHAEGEPPTWELPTLPDIESGHWKFRGRTDHTVHCHIQEIPENGADIAHLPQVHSKSVFEGNTWLDSWRALYIGRLVRHQWQPSWQADEEQPHKARIHLSQRMSVCGYTMPFSELEINIEQIGPATVFLALESSFGRGMLLQNIVPEGPLCQRIIHRLYTEPKFRAAPAAFLVWSEAVMLERDIAIWNSKKFLKNPVLVREDKLIKKFRRWYAQFYSPNSPTLQDVRDKGLDW
ncbi:cholesterol 7-desaturase nvd-like [Uloborus diversus]|uniref:cholesterol 7-desaturase nvd-like n=1 Tax=Uloborus diversus TaxID=327109 RepID=UPI002409A90E|nr:cholesterol 7-desaturase nvd-like [Uloborus diversus]